MKLNLNEDDILMLLNDVNINEDEFSYEEINGKESNL